MGVDLLRFGCVSVIPLYRYCFAVAQSIANVPASLAWLFFECYVLISFLVGVSCCPWLLILQVLVPVLVSQRGCSCVLFPFKHRVLASFLVGVLCCPRLLILQAWSKVTLRKFAAESNNVFNLNEILQWAVTWGTATPPAIKLFFSSTPDIWRSRLKNDSFWGPDLDPHLNPQKMLIQIQTPWSVKYKQIQIYNSVGQIRPCVNLYFVIKIYNKPFWLTSKPFSVLILKIENCPWQSVQSIHSRVSYFTIPSPSQDRTF